MDNLNILTLLICGYFAWQGFKLLTQAYSVSGMSKKQSQNATKVILLFMFLSCFGEVVRQASGMFNALTP